MPTGPTSRACQPAGRDGAGAADGVTAGAAGVHERLVAALLPLLIVVGAASPDDGRDVADTLIEEFRLSGSAAEALRGALARPSGPGSLIGGLSLPLLALSVGAAVYAPRAVGAAAEDFGVIGVAFSLLTLLFAFMAVLVATAAIGATLAEWLDERRS